MTLCGAVLLLSCGKETRVQSTAGKVNMEQVYAANKAKKTIQTGIWGTIANQEGNCMPGIGGSESSCKTYPVKRTVRIYEYTLMKDATPVSGEAVFYSGFKTKLIKEVAADKQGFYQAELPAGQYSVVIQEKGNWYANGSDGQGGLNPATVTAGAATELNVTMNYQAVY